MNRPRFVETRSLRYWRTLAAELRALDEAPPLYAEAETLLLCGYSIAQAVHALTGRRPALRLVVNA